MIYSIIGALAQTLFYSTDTINYKKSLVYNPKVLVFRFFGVFPYLSVIALLLLFVNINFSEYLIFWMLMGVAILNAFAGVLSQWAYVEEKISTLMPYSKIDAVIVVIVSFFIFDVSFFSFLICMFILIITIGANIDFKTFRMSKNVIYFIISKIIYGVGGVITGYALSKENFAALDFLVYDGLTYAIVTTLSVLIYCKVLKKRDFIFEKGFYITRYISFFSRILGFFVGLLLISQLGLILSTILGFLQMAVTLVMSYFAFGDKPTKRDLILTSIVTVLVFIGLYFK